VRPTVVSLFTGAGGLDLGLEAAGFEVVASIERDPTARTTIVQNRPRWNLLDTGDVLEVAKGASPRDFGLRRGELDVLAGGPPCQPFSKAAQWRDEGRLGLYDRRADCLDAIVDLAATLQPRIVLIENVPGFVARERSGLARLSRALDDLRVRQGVRYSLRFAVLRAEDYGVPQRRRRAFVIALRDDVDIVWPAPTHSGAPVRAGEAIGRVTSGETPLASGRWAGLLPSIPAGSNYLFHTPEGPGLPLFGARTRFWSFLLKLHPGEPAWTLSATPGPATGPFHWANRPLSTAEMVRLQTFPSSWEFAGSRAQIVRQIGNATPPLLAEHVARALRRALGLSTLRKLTFAIPRKPIVPRAPMARPVPEEFLSMQGDHATHPGNGRGPAPRTKRVW
jgi:DNA (cytosine-5)-methyltransferase 1